MPAIPNFLAFYAGWFACAMGPVWGEPWLGPAFSAGLIWGQSFWYEKAAKLWLLCAVVATLGTGVDSLLSVTVLRYLGQRTGSWLCPVWITALWGVFAAALPSSLAWLQGRPWLAATLGAIGGPMSYLAGERLGALHLTGDRTLAIAILAATFALAMPLLGRLTRLKWLDPRIG